MKHKSKLNNYSDLSKPQMETIDITYHKLSAKGLHIRYISGWAERMLTFTPEQTLEVLSQLSYIKGYINNGGLIIITETLNVYPSPEGEPIEEYIEEEETWVHFFRRFEMEMTDKDAQYIISYCLQQEEHEKIRQRLLAIPTIIKHFNIKL